MFSLTISVFEQLFSNAGFAFFCLVTPAAIMTGVLLITSPYSLALDSRPVHFDIGFPGYFLIIAMAVLVQILTAALWCRRIRLPHPSAFRVLHHSCLLPFLCRAIAPGLTVLLITIIGYATHFLIAFVVEAASDKVSAFYQLFITYGGGTLLSNLLISYGFLRPGLTLPAATTGLPMRLTQRVDHARDQQAGIWTLALLIVFFYATLPFMVAHAPAPEIRDLSNPLDLKVNPWAAILTSLALYIPFWLALAGVVSLFVKSVPHKPDMRPDPEPLSIDRPPRFTA